MTGDKSSSLGNTAGKVIDTLGGTAGKMSASMTATADSFVENAAIGDRYEIEAARIALTRARSADVRAVAAKMIADHTTSTHHLMAALEMNETLGVAPPPPGLDSRRESMIRHLEKAPDEDFETTYLDQQVLAHEETVTLMNHYCDNGDNMQLRSLAAGAAPVFERHLRHVQAVRAAR